VVDAIDQGVLEAQVLHRAVGADAPGHLDPDTVAGEEAGWPRGIWPESTDAPGRRRGEVGRSNHRVHGFKRC
jgi:hypothetical protein